MVTAEAKVGQAARHDGLLECYVTDQELASWPRRPRTCLKLKAGWSRASIRQSSGLPRAGHPSACVEIAPCTWRAFFPIDPPAINRPEFYYGFLAAGSSAVGQFHGVFG